MFFAVELALSVWRTLAELKMFSARRVTVVFAGASLCICYCTFLFGCTKSRTRSHCLLKIYDIPKEYPCTFIVSICKNVSVFLLHTVSATLFTLGGALEN